MNLILIFKSRESNYSCFYSVLQNKIQKYNTYKQNIKLAIILYEIRHDATTDYMLVESILEEYIINVIKFEKKIKYIINLNVCCTDAKLCKCLSNEEKIIINNILTFYEKSIKSYNNFNIHLLYKPFYNIMTCINKYNKKKPSIIMIISIRKMLHEILLKLFDYNLNI